jgi:hypothetical protein
MTESGSVDASPPSNAGDANVPASMSNASVHISGSAQEVSHQPHAPISGESAPHKAARGATMPAGYFALSAMKRLCVELAEAGTGP